MGIREWGMGKYRDWGLEIGKWENTEPQRRL